MALCSKKIGLNECLTCQIDKLIYNIQTPKLTIKDDFNQMSQNFFRKNILFLYT